MKIIVDTSVWSLVLRRRAKTVNPESVALKSIIDQGEDIYLLGVILQEILQGIKNPKDFYALKEYFEAFPFIMLTRSDYIAAAELKNYLMKQGKQTTTIDALIASAAISYNCYLFTTDKDFEQIAKHSKLKLVKNIELKNSCSRATVSTMNKIDEIYNLVFNMLHQACPKE